MTAENSFMCVCVRMSKTSHRQHSYTEDSLHKPLHYTHLRLCTMFSQSDSGHKQVDPMKCSPNSPTQRVLTYRHLYVWLVAVLLLWIVHAGSVSADSGNSQSTVGRYSACVLLDCAFPECLCVCMYVCLRVFVGRFTSTRARTHTRTVTHAFAHTHTQTYGRTDVERVYTRTPQNNTNTTTQALVDFALWVYVCVRHSGWLSLGV